MKRMLLLVIFLLANPCWGDCVLHYKMNDNAASTTVVDSQGYSNGDFNDATGDPNTNAHSVAGKINTAFSFDGTDDYVNTNATLESVFQADFTISVWAQSDDGQSSTFDYALFFNKGIDFGEAFIFNWTKHGRVYVSYGTGLGASDTVYSDVVFNDGVEEWHHIVAVCYQDGLYLTTKIYLDSVLIKSQTSESAITMADYTTSNNCEIGRSIFGRSPMNGVIDNVMVFNEALSTDEVKRLYNNGNGTEELADLNQIADCALHYKMNDNAASTTVVDSQGYSNGDFNDATGDPNTNAHSIAGKINTAFSFDGTDDYINTNATLESIFRAGFSISLWCKPDDGQPRYDKTLIGNAPSGDRANISAMSNGRIRVTYEAGGRGLSIGSAVFSDGQEDWHHIVFTAEQITATYVQLCVYFDGTLVESGQVGGDGPFACVMENYSNTNILFIGNRNETPIPPSKYFPGLIDNVMIFSEVLSTDKVEWLYNNGNGTEKLCFLEGDLNQDCCVGLNDFAVLALHWQESNCGVCGGADLDDDADVDFNDLKKLADNWLKE